MKFMLPSTLGDAEGVERFLREARSAARLKSEHVARVHDVGRLDSGAPYIVMEYLEGIDLKALHERRGPLPAHEAVRHLLQACEALAEAHAAGIVHRDLKPANLFLTTGANGGPCIKLLDFGIAKVAVGGPGAGDMTSTTALLGTPLYMSPEQMRSTRDVDARSDIWALGVILYRLLAGKTPFAGSTVMEICTAVATDQPEPISGMRGDLPPGLEGVVFHCLQKNPAQRFQRVVDLSAALAPFASAVAAAPASAPWSAQPAQPAQPTWSQPSPGGYGQGPSSTGGATMGPGGPPSSHAFAPAPMVNAYVPAPAVNAYAPPPAAIAYTAPSMAYNNLPPSGPGRHPAPVKASKTPLVVGGILALLGVSGIVVAVVLLRPGVLGGGAESGAPVAAAPAPGQPTSTARGTTPGLPAGKGQIAPATPAQVTPAQAGAAPVAAAPAGGSNLPTGGACTAASQCTSGFCVDRVCCDSACTSRCMACTAAKKHSGGGNGSCGWISGGEDPDRECGTGKRCDGDGQCVTLTPAQIKSLTSP